MVDYLVKAGLPADRFTAVGYGSTQPVATNETDEGKAQNRRIEFRGEVSAMAYLAAFHWGWLLGSLLARLRDGLDRGGASRPGRIEGDGALAGGCWWRRWSRPALARVVPGRPGYWLDLGLIMFALYLVGCAIGSWLRDWVLSRSAPAA